MMLSCLCPKNRDGPFDPSRAIGCGGGTNIPLWVCFILQLYSIYPKCLTQSELSTWMCFYILKPSLRKKLNNASSTVMQSPWDTDRHKHWHCYWLVKQQCCLNISVCVWMKQTRYNVFVSELHSLCIETWRSSDIFHSEMQYIEVV